MVTLKKGKATTKSPKNYKALSFSGQTPGLNSSKLKGNPKILVSLKIQAPW